MFLESRSSSAPGVRRHAQALRDNESVIADHGVGEISAQCSVWIIHGAKDSDAPIKDSEELIRAIEQSGGRPKFTLLPDRDHFVLDLYDKNDVFDWMSEHHR